MTISRTRTGPLIALGCLVLATTACTPSEASDDAEPTAATSASPSADAAETGDASAAATIGDTFEFEGGATIGVLGDPWTATDQVEGQLVHMIPGSPGSSVDDAVWGDLIAYVPDAAYGPGATEAEPVPADPVEWTLAHSDLEILDQREVTVDGVVATQIDARAVAPTNWLAVEGTPFEWGGDERVVLIPLDGSWLVVRGSAFQTDAAFADEPAADDPFDVVLQSVDLPG
jgi:hypothetical protein